MSRRRGGLALRWGGARRRGYRCSARRGGLGVRHHPSRHLPGRCGVRRYYGSGDDRHDAHHHAGDQRHNGPGGGRLRPGRGPVTSQWVPLRGGAGAGRHFPSGAQLGRRRSGKSIRHACGHAQGSAASRPAALGRGSPACRRCAGSRASRAPADRRADASPRTSGAGQQGQSAQYFAPGRYDRRNNIHT